MKNSVFACSTIAILILQGCGGGTTSELDHPSIDATPPPQHKLSPAARGTLPPDALPVPQASAQNRSRAFEKKISLQLNAKRFHADDTVTITMKHMPCRYDWVGLFHKGDEKVRTNLLTYIWTKDIPNPTVHLKLQNSLERSRIKGLPTGEYEVCGFTFGGNYDLLKCAPIQIIKSDRSEKNDQILSQNISFDKSEQTITLEHLQQFEGSWVGLYAKQGDTYQRITWEWVDDDEGYAVLWDVPSGAYQVRVFDEEDHVRARTDIQVDWSDGLDTRLTPTKTTFKEGEKVRVSFADMPGNPDQWLGIFPVGSGDTYEDALDTAWPDSEISGSEYFENIPAGDYVIKAFYTEYGPVMKSVKVKVVPADSSKKVAIFADEHDPHDRMLVVDYDRMSLLDEVAVEGSGVHHADVVGDVDSADYVLMVPKRSRFLNVYNLHDKTLVKKISLPFRPRSADAYNAAKNLVLLTSANRPAAVVLDADTWEIVGRAGFNISCDLKFNEGKSRPWYYKRIVYKNHDIEDEECSAPDFGGSLISGHPIWLDDTHFAINDRANRMIHLFKLGRKKSDGMYDIRLTDAIATSTSVHQMIPSGNHDNIFYAQTEGNGNGDGIAPVVYKFKLRGDHLITLGKTDLITKKTVDIMKKLGIFDQWQSYWNQYRTYQSYYHYYYPTAFDADQKSFYPGSAASYYSGFFNRFQQLFKNKIHNFEEYFAKNVPIKVQKIFKSLGGHNLYISPKVNGHQYTWSAIASGQVFVTDTSDMELSNVIPAAKGAGHVTFEHSGPYAVITNHKSRKVTIANYITQKFVKNVELPFEKEGISQALQSHAPYITLDDRYFINSWTDGGVFFRIDLDTLQLDDKSLYVGGVPIQGNYYPHYIGD